jgi:radical SAM superfamily enzyme YgiQ (UPF0313 family)
MRVVLIGAEFEENLAVRYLRGALERAGHDVLQVVFNEAEETERAAREVVGAGAPLVGLSMVFTHRARQFARLAERVRELGYTGHIVAGGHFAAFHPELLLRDVLAIDSVAIGEGEDLLVELSQRLGDLALVRGLVYRDAAGEVRRNAPAEKPPDLDRLARPPRKQPLDDYLGLPITNILSSRGCSYSCTFCSIVAWHRLCGGERVRMRTVDRVADEVADLYRSGARIFNFHDDNFFLPDREAMLERVAELGRALEVRGVGKIAFAIKARPDGVDEEIFLSLTELGLFRVFLGIEAGSPQSLKQLGRRQTLEQNERALEIMNRLDVHTAFNLLIFNPDSALEDVAENVRFLRRHPDNPMNFCRTEIYAGTPLEKKLRHEGRLLGDYWGWDYTIADPRTEMAFELVFAAFRSRNYGDKCLHHLTMQVDYEHQILAHFFATRTDLRRRVKRFIALVNRNTADHLDRAIAACARGFADAGERRRFTGELTRAVEADNARLGATGFALIDEIRERALAPAEPAAGGFRRAARALGIAATVTLAASGCRKATVETHPTETVAAPPTAPITPDASEDAAPEAEAPSEGGAETSDAGAADAEPRDAAPDAKPKPKPKPVPTTHPREMAPRPQRPSYHSEMIAEPPDKK